jgi:hypothetical protein
MNGARSATPEAEITGMRHHVGVVDAAGCSRPRVLIV